MTRRVLMVAVAASGLAVGLALAGCGAGTDAATSSTRSSIPGVNADDAGVAIRNARVPAAPNPAQGYPAGADVPVELSVINNGPDPVQLVDQSSPAAGPVTVVRAVPVGGTAPPDGGGPPNGGAGPQLLLAPGEAVAATLRVTGVPEPLTGLGSLPLVLTFDNGAAFTLTVPSAPPDEPLPREQPVEPTEETH